MRDWATTLNWEAMLQRDCFTYQTYTVEFHSGLHMLRACPTTTKRQCRAPKAADGPARQAVACELLR